MTKQERRTRLMNDIRERLSGQAAAPKRKRVVRKRRNAAVPADEAEQLPRSQPDERYHIANNKRNRHQLSVWLHEPERKDDVAL
jgi:hypothetical protein